MRTHTIEKAAEESTNSTSNETKGGLPKGSKNIKKIIYDPVTGDILLTIPEKIEKHKHFTIEDLNEYLNKKKVKNK